MPISKLFTVETVAEYLAVEPSTVRRYIRDGRLPASIQGNRYYVREDDLEDYMDEIAEDDDDDDDDDDEEGN